MYALLKKPLLFAIMGIFAFMFTGCSRYWDLAKIAGHNFLYEMQHPVQPPAARLKSLSPENLKSDQIYAAWIGHSTVLLSLSGTLILTDPNFSPRIKIARRIVGLPIEPEEIPSLHLILISHAHYDHLDPTSLRRLPKEAWVVVPPGCRTLVEGLGFAGIKELGWNQRFVFQDLEIEAFQPAHWGRRSPFDDEDRGYNAYLLTKEGQTVLFAGDTGYSSHFAEKTKGKDVLLAFLPITAYRPEWFRRNHTSPEEALRMFLESGAQFMIPIHWGTFILSHEPIDEPIERLKAEAKRLGIQERVIILRHGESFTRSE
jgi:L-ascorbate metabolism protein UlaG (beta-lactamase superfamily)